jgi:DNA invertase Pin-like site-specific DNA recombinase
MTAVGYVRLSKRHEQGVSIAAQREAIMKAAEERGLELVEVVEDDGLSGRSLRRPGVQRALELMEDADVLLVARLDRLSRCVRDFASILHSAQRGRWDVVALDMGMDTSTPQGRFFSQILMSVAEFERELIGERTKAALAYARSNGTTLGRPSSLPQETIERIASERGEGRAYARIAEGLNDDAVPTAHGGQRWYASTVRNVANRA